MQTVRHDHADRQAPSQKTHHLYMHSGHNVLSERPDAACEAATVSFSLLHLDPARQVRAIIAHVCTVTSWYSAPSKCLV